VVLAPGWPRESPELAVLDVAYRSFACRAIARLKQAGCRRPAVITFPRDAMEPWSRLCRAQQLALRPYWFQQLSQEFAHSGRYLARLLFRDDQSDRPDGVIVTDDNLAGPVTQGMADAGVFEEELTEAVALPAR
jgi:DNA-binding LacI/PurR family transcriptional regulator